MKSLPLICALLLSLLHAGAADKPRRYFLVSATLMFTDGKTLNNRPVLVRIDTVTGDTCIVAGVAVGNGAHASWQRISEPKDPAPPMTDIELELQIKSIDYCLEWCDTHPKGGTNVTDTGTFVVKRSERDQMRNQWMKQRNTLIQEQKRREAQPKPVLDLEPVK